MYTNTVRMANTPGCKWTAWPGTLDWRSFARLYSDLVPKHGAREQFLMGTNVNTTQQVPTPEFGHGACDSGTELGTDISSTQCLSTAPFGAGARVLVLGHQV